MAKKFFNKKVHNSRKTITTFIIVGVCVIGVIICFIITSSLRGKTINKPEKSLNLKESVNIELNEKITNDIFFSKVENFDINEVKVTYPDNFDISKPGRYDVTLTIEGKDYTSTLVVLDVTRPTLITKDLTINENENYRPIDFVSKCSDDSKEDCIVAFYRGINEEGEEADYSNYRTAGTYVIKITASDSSGNQAIEEAKLTIKGKATSNPVVPPVTNVCKYGNTKYDISKYLVAIDITANNCAISLDMYKDASMTGDINKLMENESYRIQKDVDKLNLAGTFALSRKVTAVVNTAGSGIVGYELSISVVASSNNQTNTIAEYKVDKNGKRVFTQNPYNLGQ